MRRERERVRGDLAEGQIQQDALPALPEGQRRDSRVKSGKGIGERVTAEHRRVCSAAQSPGRHGGIIPPGHPVGLRFTPGP